MSRKLLVPELYSLSGMPSGFGSLLTILISELEVLGVDGLVLALIITAPNKKITTQTNKYLAFILYWLYFLNLKLSVTDSFSITIVTIVIQNV